MSFLLELNKQFKYRRDVDQYGSRDAWFIMKHPPYVGDCEDCAKEIFVDQINSV